MKKLHKSKYYRMLDGVCAGFAEYFELDYGLVRLMYILFGLIFPISAILFYVMAMVIMPENEYD